jgi:predicted AlkP superfamily phosphohydrolase/phosphomutase
MLAILQFDAPSVSLLDRMVSAGRLPTLARLRSRAAPRPMETSAALFEGAVYPTLYSGSDVAEHGIYGAFPWDASAQRVQSMLAVPRPETVWERIGRAGRRSLVVDPYTGWRTDAPGVFLSGWQFRNRMVLPHESSPRDAHRTLARELGPPPDAQTVFGRLSDETLRDLGTALRAAPARAADVVVHLLPRERFDLVWVTFSGAHLAGHHLWPGENGTGTTILEEIYVAVDAAIARIWSALPPDADVLVLSPDGMGANTSRSDLLPDMLHAVLAGGAPATSSSAGGGVWRMRAAVPRSLRGATARVIGDDLARRLVARWHFRSIDWRRTRAFALPGDCAGFVRLNLRDRERDGIVAPADARTVMDEIATGLMTFRDPDGAPAVGAVESLPASVASGRNAHALPDLIVRWTERPTATLTGVTSARFGTVARNGAGPGLAGNHVEGAWIQVLPGPSRVRDLGRTVRLPDVAATACALLGADAHGLPGSPFLVPA